MGDVQCEDRLRPLREGQKRLSDKIADLAAMSEDSQAMLQEAGWRQALVVQLASDIAEMQKKLLCEMAEAAGGADSDSLGDGDDLMAAHLEPEWEVSQEKTGSVIETSASKYSREEDVAWWQWALTPHSRSFLRKGTMHWEPMPSLGSTPPCEWLRLFARRLLRDPLFDFIVGLTILTNAICIGVEIDMELRNENNSTVVALEYFFLCFYVAELSLRFFAHGLGCLRNGWVFFDFVLVVVGALSLFLARPIIASLETGADDDDFMETVHHIMFLRMVRFFRLARAVRIISFFKSLWKLVLGFIHSLSTIFSTAVLISISIYVFACIGVELITKDPLYLGDAATAKIVTENFRSVPSIMLTLVQFATLDSIASIYYPLITVNPWLCLYFIPILLILSVAVMNLVTALIVEDALASTALDRETALVARRRELKKMIPTIKQVFTELDTSKDGCIQIPEIINNLSRVHARIPPELADVLTPDKLVDLFEFLDLDGSGELSEDEFVDGVCHLALMNVPVETTQILQLLRHHRREMGVVRRDMMQLKRQFSSKSKGATGTSRARTSGIGPERPARRGRMQL